MCLPCFWTLTHIFKNVFLKIFSKAFVFQTNDLNSSRASKNWRAWKKIERMTNISLARMIRLVDREKGASSRFVQRKLYMQVTLLEKKVACFPPKAYWNNLDPGPIPAEIETLTLVERRLLARINPYLKIIKFDGRFGQYGLKGQAIHFAYDLFEIVDKLSELY